MSGCGMSERPETIADIIAEMRKYATDYYGRTIENGGEKGNPGMFYCDMAQFAKVNADRLDAAYKRERGDCAKLREAASYLTSIFSCDIQFLERHAKELRDTGAYGGGIIEHILHSITLARAALAAPPRNCDRFDSSTQARAEWYKTEVLPRVEGVVSGVEPPFVDWLFAPATEKEGGNDGNE